MSAMLRDDDRRAIDLLLDRGQAAAGGNGRDVMNLDATGVTGYSSHASPVDPDRLRGVQQVLSLLSYMPEDELPAGLLERTLARVEQSVGRAAADHVAYRPSLHADPSVPHA